MSAVCLRGSCAIAARILILRPAPGNAATVGLFAMRGIPALAIPLYRVEPLPWRAPDPTAFDALLLTSANAARHAGVGLAALQHLPAWCVGPATADAAQGAGLTVARTGATGITDLLADAPPARLLWLCGQHRTAIDPPASIIITALPVYAAIDLSFPPSAVAQPCVALVHSARAAQRFAAVATVREHIALVAISAAVAAAAGVGWHSVTVAAQPDDGEMVEIAARLCQTLRHG